ncbi:DDE-type integrase/transposase/recombinase [Rhizobacter sp. Root16D2]|uniref:DDE-type integrase/transposase/recombinase n=1 Tax=Rhizobacter sp. Root16D2 TaxID=1736479 RepID=UPI0006FDA9AD|nr:DDE-type integrase/transposase/recombinase [Rhizobacter sp. Root16D2]KRB24777.1 hypothetical protein ASE08_00835 [Rhizobacter sp. Root16D2]
MQIFRKDQVIFLEDVALRVCRALGSSEVQLENVSTGELSTRKTFSLCQAYAEGRLKTVADRKHELSAGVVRARPAARMTGMSDSARAETRRRMDILNHLQKMGSFEKSRKDLRVDLRLLAAVRGEVRPPHESTIYRWRRKYLKAHQDVRALFVEFDKQGGKGQTRLNSAVEALIDDKIETVFLAAKRGSATDVYDAVFLAIQLENAKRPDAEHLAVPGLRTIQRRIADLYAFERAVAEYGPREAERRFASHGRARKVARILEIVEIDHTLVDLMVTDDNRIVVGRPTLTVVLCRASRCVLGFHLSLAGHGVPAVFSALRHAMLPKTYLLKRYGDLCLDWPCFGWPERIVVDNGREFHADAIRDAMASLEVLVEYAGSRDPNDKPFVERFLRTFNYTFIHKLQGTTLSNVHERVGFQAEKEACLTLAELDQMIHVWICDVYHRRPHAGLDGRAPIDVWNEGAQAYPPQLKMNRADIDIEFSDLKQSALQHYGIDLNNFVYASPRLALLRRMLPKDAGVTVKWPRNEAGHIWVWDTTANEYFEVPNKETEYAGLTVEQAKAAKKRKAEGSPDYRQTNAEAKAINAETVAAALADKKLKARRRGARHDNQTSDDFRDHAGESAPAEPPVEAPPPPPVVHAKVKVDVPEDVESEA